jgi:hypothetical protein
MVRPHLAQVEQAVASGQQEGQVGACHDSRVVTSLA